LFAYQPKDIKLQKKKGRKTRGKRFKGEGEADEKIEVKRLRG